MAALERTSLILVLGIDCMSKELTTTQLLREISKTDRVIANWEKASKALLKHKDESNSSRLHLIRDVVKNLFDDLEED